MALSSVWIVYLTSAFLNVAAAHIIRYQPLNDQSNVAATHVMRYHYPFDDNSDLANDEEFRKADATAPKHWKSKELYKGVYSFTTISGGYWSMFVVTNQGVVAFDSCNSNHSGEMLKAIKEVTDKPVKYLLLTHNHWDHSSGGKVFRNAGAKIIAHAEAYDYMKANPHSDMILPDEGWCGKRKDITLGETTIELHYYGINHGLGNTVFFLPKQKMIYVADIVSPGGVVFAFLPDNNIKEQERTINEILKLDFERGVFTHSFLKNAIDGGTKQDVKDILQYIKDLRAAIDAEIKKGVDPYSLPYTLKLPKYENWPNYKEYLPMNIYKVLVSNDMGPFPWRPISVPSLCVKGRN